MKKGNKLSESELLLKAYMDEATGVLNRGATMREIEDFLNGEGSEGVHALIMLDLDNLKQVNDLLGHQSGDVAISNIAHTVAKYFSPDDIVGRVGGDEFFVFDKYIDEKTIGSKVAKLLENLQIVLGNSNKHIALSVSAGVAIYRGDAEIKKNLQMLYAEADVGLYKAKTSGKNTYSFAEDFDFVSYKEGKSEEEGAHSVFNYNNLEIGIIVFRGSVLNDIVPIFCNDGFLKLTGLSYEQFKDFIVKENLYGIHPDDVAGVRQKFLEAYEHNHPIQHTLRVKTAKGDYKWVAVFGKIKYLKDGSYEAYLVFSDAEEERKYYEIDIQRYNSLIVGVQNNSPDALSLIHFNLTKNSFTIIRREDTNLKPLSHVQTFDSLLYEFLYSFEDEKIRNEFFSLFNRDSMKLSFEKGTFVIRMKMPLTLEDGRVLWCYQTASMARNPVTSDIEGILLLIEADRDIRAREYFNRLIETDYDFVGSINTETNIVSILSETNTRGLVEKGNKAHLYEENLFERLKVLIEPEFVEECYANMRFEKIVSELEKQDVYTVVYPANHVALNIDGIFQWRFCYVDMSKREIMFSRKEKMAFLTKDQRAEMTLAHNQRMQISQSARSGESKRNTILIADDVELNREMLQMIFEDDFKIIQAEDGEKAIELIDKYHENLALILLDLLMPKKNGLEVLMHIRMRDLTEKIPVIMVTGSSSLEVNLKSLEYGISDIINKPFDSKIVKRRALNLIELYAHKEDVERQLQKWKEDAIMMHKRDDRNKELLIDTLSSVVEFRSQESGLHINRVRALTDILLRTWLAMYPETQLSDRDVSLIVRASTLHDIGKVAIPDNILLKPGRLTKEEFEIMKEHTTRGCAMLEPLKEDYDFYRYAYDISRHHHEKYDGKGYPDGLKGDEIPLWAQIVSIVDCYDALTSPRVYKAAYSPQEAIRMIRDGECGLFSEKLLECFAVAQNQIIQTSKRLSLEEQK